MNETSDASPLTLEEGKPVSPSSSVEESSAERKNQKRKKQKKVKKALTLDSLFTFFVVFFLASLFICLILAMASEGDSWKQMLFHNGPYTDLYMDFFNSIRDGGSPDVYTARNNIYPPLCVLIFRFLSKLIPPRLVSSRFDERKALLSNPVCMTMYILFALVSILLLMRMIEIYARKRNGKKYKTYATILAFLSIVCYPVMYCLERGNILILSVVCSMFFIFFRNSESAVVRHISYISLAMAAAIKIYPAVFGLILIVEKKYKEALKAIAYGVVIVVFPIVFFIKDFKTTAGVVYALSGLLDISPAVLAAGESSSVFGKMISNLLTFAFTKKNSLNLSSVSVQNVVFMAEGDTKAAVIVCLFFEALAVIALLFAKREWQKVFLITYLMLNIPSASSSYSLSFLLIPFVVFLFGNNKFRNIDKLNILGFTLLLTPLPTLWYYHPEKIAYFTESFLGKYVPQFNQLIATFVFQALFLMIFVDVIVSAAELRKIKKQTSEKIKKEKNAKNSPESVKNIAFKAGQRLSLNAFPTSQSS